MKRYHYLKRSLKSEFLSVNLSPKILFVSKITVMFKRKNSIGIGTLECLSPETALTQESQVFDYALRRYGANIEATIRNGKFWSASQDNQVREQQLKLLQKGLDDDWSSESYIIENY